MIRPVALALSLAAGPAAAHPHVFVEAAVTVIYDGGAATAIRVDWVYDDFFSLLLMSDLGLDLDGDMVLESEEVEALSAAVTEWPEDFEGDLWVRADGSAVGLAPKEAHDMTYAEGIVTESHVRPLARAVEGELTLQVYDPWYFVAYDVTEVRFEGRDDCAASFERADLDAARARVEEMIGKNPMEVGPEEDFPKVGAEFADTIRVTCG